MIVRSLALGLPPRHRLETHDHPWPQLFYATEGVLSFEWRHGAWVVPPLRAVWIPSGVEHGASTIGHVALRTLYVQPRLAAGLGNDCRVLHVTPLLRELILDVVRRRFLDRRRPSARRLAGVLVDEILEAEQTPADLPLPKDPRARRLADKIRAEPASTARVAELARNCGATPRMLERLFKKESGLSLGRWRRHARLASALHRLARGDAVTDVALASGYESPSAFIAMFKRELGTTPSRYF